MSTLACSLCSLIPKFLLNSRVLDVCCLCLQLANFLLAYSLHIACAIVGTILFINIRSFPLVWHITVLLPFGIVRCKYNILSIRHTLLLRPSATRHKAVVSQLESCCPVGANPFDFTATCTSWASPDETDWFGHVNNSTYATARDAALSKFGLAGWPTFVNAGGWIALGSTHYHFLHEIPCFAGYEMKMSIGAWDHKWLYLVCRFTSHSTKLRGKSSSSTNLEDPSIFTQFSTQSTTNELGSSASGSEDETPSTVLASRMTHQPNRTILNCFTVSRLCFKMGRITVPPAIVMACEGFSNPPEHGSYSHQSPPPHWVHPHTLRNTSDSLETYRSFLAGGWRDVPESNRWWVEPLSGPIEERRRASLEKLEVIDKGVIDCMSDIW